VLLGSSTGSSVKAAGSTGSTGTGTAYGSAAPAFPAALGAASYGTGTSYGSRTKRDAVGL